jgi:hypothetical protein
MSAPARRHASGPRLIDATPLEGVSMTHSPNSIKLPGLPLIDFPCLVIVRPLPHLRVAGTAEQRMHALTSGEVTHGIDISAPRFASWAAEDAARSKIEQPTSPPDGLLTRAEAAHRLRCTVKTLNRYIASGALRYVPIGHGTKRQRKMFKAAYLDDFIANQARKDVPRSSDNSR